MTDMYGFYTGKVLDAYEYLGAHITSDGTIFRTFAPSAQKVGLLWNGQEIPMQSVYDGNFYEMTVKEAKAEDTYEYRIYMRNNGWTYGFGMELRPDHKSVIVDRTEYSFHDGEWMKHRTALLDKPLNIYELHLGSWRRKGTGKEDWYRYDELAQPLADYLKESGYNYVEFLPISEHPCDESWGYQNTGFFAPTSRYGTPADLKRLIDTLHPALSEQDYQENGFYWLDCHQEPRCIYAICRRSKDECLCAIFNFGQHVQKDYTVTIPDATDIVPLLYSDWEPFGGHTPLTESVCKLNGDKLTCTLQLFSALLLEVKSSMVLTVAPLLIFPIIEDFKRKL